MKKSFGTAVKFWGNRTWANVSTYGKLAILTFIVMNDPVWMEQGVNYLGPGAESLERIDLQPRLCPALPVGTEKKRDPRRQTADPEAAVLVDSRCLRLRPSQDLHLTGW